jgi:hypothetical protein
LSDRAFETEKRKPLFPNALWASRIRVRLHAAGVSAETYEENRRDEEVKPGLRLC